MAVQCSADTFVVNQTLVLRINICGENRHLRQARNRCVQLPIDVAESCDKTSIGVNIRLTHSVESNSNAENCIFERVCKNQTNMKINYFFFSFLVILFSSCKKSENSLPSIIGKWYIDSIQIGSNLTTNNPNIWAIYRNTGENFYRDFNSDGKIYIYGANNSYDTIPNYELVRPVVGSSYIKYQPPNGTSTDTIIDLTDHRLILLSAQGSKSKLFFSK